MDRAAQARFNWPGSDQSLAGAPKVPKAGDAVAWWASEVRRMDEVKMDSL